MSGFNNDWRCLHRRRDGHMASCPPGGCSEEWGCARDRQDSIERLTGTRPSLRTVAEPGAYPSDA